MKKFKNIALTFIAIVISITAINATPVTPAASYKGEEPFTVKYIGNEGEYLLFQVIVNSDNAKNTSFKISDKAEGEIYKQNINAAYKMQTMKIEKRDGQELDFKLMIGKVEYSKSFSILSTITVEAK